MKKINLIQGTSQWLEWRKNHLTATNSSAVMGMNPYQTKYDLWMEKTLGWEREFTPKELERMNTGHEMEPLARQAFIDETGLVVYPYVGEHDEYNFLGASFDGITEDGRFIVEIKCGKKSFMLAQLDEIPPYYFCQMQHQMLIAKCPLCFYYCFNGTESVIKEIHYNHDFILEMLENEIEFWNDVQTFTPPKEYYAIPPTRPIQ